MKIIFIAAMAFGNTVSAATISDANFIDNGTYTSDKVSGLDWLDLSATLGRSFDDVSANMGAGQAFAGWTIASSNQFSQLLDNFGGNSNYYGDWSYANNGLFDVFAALLGDIGNILSPTFYKQAGDGYAQVVLDDGADASPYTSHARMYDTFYDTTSLLQDNVQIQRGANHTKSFADRYWSVGLVRATGSAPIVQASAVPEPSTVLLLPLGLIALIVRKKGILEIS